jgi:hypothetical protein
LPRRSNIFQRLVTEIHQTLNEGWTITESQPLKDRQTGEMREVDIVAEADTVGYPILIGVEVRDRKRPADVTWVESVLQKHADLPTTRLVLWSRSGFTKTALKKATAHKAITLTPGTLNDAPWATIARDVVGSSLKQVTAQFDPVVDVQLPDGTITRWNAPQDMKLNQIGGAQVGHVGDILAFMEKTPEVGKVLLDHAPTGSGSYFAVYNPPFPCAVTNLDGVTGTLTRMIVGITTICEIAPVTAMSAVHDSTVTTLAEANFTDGTMQVVITEPASGSAEIRAKKRKRLSGKSTNPPKT